jgi:hypothetical protein
MKQYKILGQMKMEKLEEELNRLADDGWHVSVVYPYQFKEQLKMFILLENHHGRSGCSALHMLHHQFMGQ